MHCCCVSESIFIGKKCLCSEVPTVLDTESPMEKLAMCCQLKPSFWSNGLMQILQAFILCSKKYGNIMEHYGKHSEKM